MASVLQQTTTTRKTRSQLKAEINALADRTLAANIMRVPPKESNAGDKQVISKHNGRSRDRLKSAEEDANKAATTKSKQSRKRHQTNQEATADSNLVENEQPSTTKTLTTRKDKQTGKTRTRKESYTSNEEREQHVTTSKRGRKKSTLPPVNVADDKYEPHVQHALGVTKEQLYNNNNLELEPKKAFVKQITIKDGKRGRKKTTPPPVNVNDDKDELHFQRALDATEEQLYNNNNCELEPKEALVKQTTIKDGKRGRKKTTPPPVNVDDDKDELHFQRALDTTEEQLNNNNTSELEPNKALVEPTTIKDGKRGRKKTTPPPVNVDDDKDELHFQRALDITEEQLNNNNTSELEPNKALVEPTTIKDSCNNNNNNSDYIDIEAQQEYNRIVQHKTDKLKALNAAIAVPLAEAAKVGWTHEQLNQFLLNSSLSRRFPDALLPDQSASQLFRGFIASIYAMEQLQLDELLDLFHLCIMMQHYEQMDTHCMGYRCQLLEAVCELASELQPEDADSIGISLCDRLVMGTGKKRMERVIEIHSSIVQFINNGEDASRRIAMSMLLATFSKVSGLPIPELKTDVVTQAFEMAQQVDWTKLVTSECVEDMFVLVRSFGLILNTQENRRVHSDWNNQLGSKIHNYFMTVLRPVRCSRNYNFFAMMVERYIAFCVIRGATARAHTTETLPD
ncbi:hypothetical protein KR093_009227 [Drosophila rubida]|uniref:Uncharacterized protein n=1 Tax=Drosophila rubida TaxID=30044 RepID=A0AAD4KD68_9MUSC|nr:hypothetical protein KR093_009227 [Drosophila rubida]